MNEYLLFFSLFLPRLTLLVAWLTGGIPPNNFPLFLEMVTALFLPRALVCFYIVTTLGWDSPWLILHVIAWIVAFFFTATREG